MLGGVATVTRSSSRRRRTIDELGVGGTVTAAQLVDGYAADAPSASADDDEPRTFGHVIVDEAQDLSAMQWRMLARRCPSSSMTIVGDVAQASRPGALATWDDVVAELPNRVPPQLVTLTVNYRTPAEIMEFANRLLPAAAALGIEPARFGPQHGRPPRRRGRSSPARSSRRRPRRPPGSRRSAARSR